MCSGIQAGGQNLIEFAMWLPQAQDSSFPVFMCVYTMQWFSLLEIYSASQCIFKIYLNSQKFYRLFYVLFPYRNSFCFDFITLCMLFFHGPVIVNPFLRRDKSITAVWWIDYHRVNWKWCRYFSPRVFLKFTLTTFFEASPQEQRYN